jgi:hypothetical protein
MLGRYTTGPLPVGESTSPRLGPPAARVGGRHRFVDGPTQVGRRRRTTSQAAAVKAALDPTQSPSSRRATAQ